MLKQNILVKVAVLMDPRLDASRLVNEETQKLLDTAEKRKDYNQEIHVFIFV